MKCKIKKLCTVLLILSLITFVGTVKMYAKEQNDKNVLPAVDILVIEAENAQGYN